MILSISFHISDTYQYPYPSTIVISIQVISISKWSLKTILKYDIIHIIPYKWSLSYLSISISKYYSDKYPSDIHIQVIIKNYIEVWNYPYHSI